MGWKPAAALIRMGDMTVFVVVGGVFLLWPLMGVLRFWVSCLKAGPFAQDSSTGDLPRAAVLGDSITYGTISYPYLELLRRDSRTAGWDVRNGGRNHWKVRDLIDRMDTLLACRPGAVIITIGTNDVQDEFRNFQHLDGEALQLRADERRAVFQEELEELFREIRSRLGRDVLLAITDIPPLGEDFASPVMFFTREFNRMIAAAAEKAGAAFLPVYSEMQDVCLEHYERQMPSAERIQSTVVLGILLRFLLFFSYGRISRVNQFVLHTDYVHFNRRGGEILADKMADFLAFPGVSGRRSS